MDLFLITDSIGIAFAAISGFLFAVNKGCDWLGIFIASFLTGLGGGIMRDTFIGRDIYSFTNNFPVIIVIVVMVLAIALKIHRKKEIIESMDLFIFMDALGFVSFSIVGSMIAISAGYTIFGVMIVAFCNGVGGGILRDVLLNEVPQLLTTGLYGTICLIIGFVYYLMDKVGLTSIFYIVVLLIFGVAFRMIAYKKSWHLPTLQEEN